MAKINFYLKNPSDDCETLIYLMFRYNGNQLKYSTGEKIHPKNWNFNNQRAKKGSFIGHSQFNDYLSLIEEKINSVYRAAKMMDGVPSVSFLREKLNKELGNNHLEKSSFIDVLQTYIDEIKENKSENTVKKFATLKSHLIDFCTSRNTTLSFNDMDMGFFQSLVTYLYDTKGHQDNTVAKYVIGLKVFLKWAAKKDLHSNSEFENYNEVKERSADIVYLTEEELIKLHNMDLSKNSKLERVRDLFCLQCFSGLRFSDIRAMRPENVKKDAIVITTQKTKDFLSIPLNDYSREIIERYKDNPDFLPKISNQKMNKYLKDLAKKAEIDEMETITQYKKNKAIKTRLAKYNFISTHTARRTFVTLSLLKGMRISVIMNITGHTSYVTFKKYVKITDRVTQNEMQNVWKKVA